MNNVLVLNQDYSPLTLCSVQRAFILLYLNKAELINSDKNLSLRSINQSFSLPSVIKINRYIRIPFRGVILTRHNVFKRDRFACQYCGNTSNLTLDHLIPKSKGGKTNWTNLVTACKSCNSKKGDELPEDVGLILSKKPVSPSYIMFLKSANYEKKEWLRFLEPKAYA